LERILKEDERSYQEQHEALLANTIPNLGEFIENAQSKHVQAYLECRGPLIDKGVDKLVSTWKSSISDLANLIFGTKSKKELQEAVQSKLPSALSYAERQLQKALRAITKALEESADHEHRRFFEQFQEHYRRLASLGGRVQSRERRHESKATEGFRSGVTTRHKEVAISINSQLSAEFGNKAGGAVGGAVIGTMLLPGVGTILGGLLGGIFGALFGPSLAELQNECWSKLAPALDDSFSHFAHAADECIDRVGREIAQNLVEAIAGYHSQYAQLVRDMVARDKERSKQLDQLRQAIAKDRQQIRTRQERLSNIQERLRNR